MLLVSEASMASNWVLEEVDTAITQNLIVIPVFLAPVELQSFHPISVHLKYLQRLDLYGDFDRAVAKLMDAIGGGDRFGQAGEAPVKSFGDHANLPDKPKPAVPPAQPQSGSDHQGKPHRPSNASKPANSTARPSASEQQTSVGLDERRIKARPDRRINHKALLERLTRDVDRGDREAAYLLSRLYSTGLYVDKDHGRAVRYLQLASQGPRGLPEAYHDLADKYRLAKGVGRNPQKAIALLEQAAQRGYAPAFYRLGRIYQDGDIAPRDHARAFRRFSAAAKLDYAPAHFRLAEAQVSGLGTDQDYERAYTSALTAAEKHYPPALNLLGRFHRKGIHVPQSDEMACDWYEKAMRQGSPEGAFNLASMYRRGLGRPKDELLARRYSEAASRLLSGADPEQVLREASMLVETEGGAL